METYGGVLYDGGHHHTFRSLSCRILDAVKWSTSLMERASGKLLVSHVIDLLVLHGDRDRGHRYLKQYHASVVPGTQHYLSYLSVAAHVLWREEDFPSALQLVEEYERLSTATGINDQSMWDIPQLKAMALRDSGRAQEALEILDPTNEVAQAQETVLGNSARCMFKMKKYTEAESLLRSSLTLLLNHRGYVPRTNLGYAYMWLAENMQAQDRVREAKAFLLMAKHMWREYAPFLLPQLEPLATVLAFNIEKPDISEDEARVIHARFLSSEHSLIEFRRNKGSA